MAQVTLDLASGERVITAVQVSTLSAFLADGCENGLRPEDCQRLAAFMQIYVHPQVKAKPAPKSRTRRKGPPPSNLIPFPNRLA